MDISKNLRATLRYFGYTKVAEQVMRDQAEYVGDLTALDGAIKSISVKVATNRQNERVISDGVLSLQLFRSL